MEKKQILVVEDEVIIAKDIQYSLENLGYSASSLVATGEEAIIKAGEDCPDLVLMDIVLLGDIDGVEAAQKIRSQFDIPVIYMTAYADDEILERAKITEPFGYMIKPFEERELHSNIQMALYKHKMEKSLRQAKEKAEEARKVAEQANRLKSEFLANISHELRTPLNSIIGFPRIVNHSLKKFPQISQKSIDEAARCLEIVSTQGDQLLALINDLLDISIIEAGRLELKEEPILAHSLLLSIIKNFEVEATKKDISLLDNRAEQEDFQFMGDIHRLKQVLKNLVQNAIKFSDKGSIKLNIFPRGDRIFFQVHDEGVGMTPEETELIFDRFYQLDGSSTRQHRGVGLGLNLVKKLVEKMEGTVAVESEKMEKSIFTVELPWKRPKEEETRPLGKKILLVEEKPETQSLVQSIFPDNEFTVVERSDQALDTLQTNQDFDLILWGQTLPKMTGEMLMMGITANHPGLKTPIIMAASDGSEESVEATYSLARDLELEFRYVNGPFTQGNINHALKELGGA